MKIIENPSAQNEVKTRNTYCDKYSVYTKNEINDACNAYGWSMTQYGSDSINVITNIQCSKTTEDYLEFNFYRYKNTHSYYISYIESKYKSTAKAFKKDMAMTLEELKNYYEKFYSKTLIEYQKNCKENIIETRKNDIIAEDWDGKLEEIATKHGYTMTATPSGISGVTLKDYKFHNGHQWICFSADVVKKDNLQYWSITNPWMFPFVSSWYKTYICGYENLIKMFEGVILMLESHITRDYKQFVK